MKILSFTGKAFALLFAAAFILVLPLTLITHNIQQHLMQPELYKSALEAQNVYAQIPDLVAEEIVTTLAQNDPATAKTPEEQVLTELLQSLDQEDWRDILITLMPADWAQTEAEAGLDDLFTFLDGQTETLELSLSLAPLKANLEGPQGELVLARLVEALPPCTEADLFNFILETLTTGSPTIPVCAPPAELLGENMQTLQFLLPLAAQQIPDTLSIQLTVADFEIAHPEKLAGQSNLVLLYRQIKPAFQWSLAAAFGLLVLIAVLAVRSLRGLAFWWGWPLTVGSAVVVAPIFSNRAGISAWLTQLIVERIPAVISPNIAALLEDVIRQLNSTLLDALMKQAVILLVLGIALLVLGRALKPQQKTSVEVSPTEENTPIE